jgi:hypothetical protein
MFSKMPLSLTDDTYLQLEDLLAPETRGRAVAKRKQWLDGTVSPCKAATRESTTQRAQAESLDAIAVRTRKTSILRVPTSRARY